MLVCSHALMATRSFCDLVGLLVSVSPLLDAVQTPTLAALAAFAQDMITSPSADNGQVSAAHLRWVTGGLPAVVAAGCDRGCKAAARPAFVRNGRVPTSSLPCIHYRFGGTSEMLIDETVLTG